MEIDQKTVMPEYLRFFSQSCPDNVRYGGEKAEVCKRNANFISYSRCDRLKRCKMTVFALNLKDCTFFNVIIPISTSHVQQLPSTSLGPEYRNKTISF